MAFGRQRPRAQGRTRRALASGRPGQRKRSQAVDRQSVAIVYWVGSTRSVGHLLKQAFSARPSPRPQYGDIGWVGAFKSQQRPAKAVAKTRKKEKVRG